MVMQPNATYTHKISFAWSHRERRSIVLRIFHSLVFCRHLSSRFCLVTHTHAQIQTKFLIFSLLRCRTQRAHTHTIMYCLCTGFKGFKEHQIYRVFYKMFRATHQTFRVSFEKIQDIQSHLPDIQSFI